MSKKICVAQQLLDIIYPIGSLYFTVVDDTAQKVHSRFGGNWELFGAGRTPVCVDPNDSDFNTVEKTGGEKKHKLTVDEIPSHNHRTPISSGGNLSIDSYSGYEWVTTGRWYNWTSATGGDQPHNNLQPYKTCYIWKRVAD